MKEVLFKNKEANHGLRLNGKRIQFKEGKAKVSDAEAEQIKEMNNPDYTIVEPEIKEEKPKRKRRTSKKKKEE